MRQLSSNEASQKLAEAREFELKGELDRVEILARQVLDSSHDSKYHAESLSLLCRVARHRGDYEVALEYGRRSLALSEKAGDIAATAKARWLFAQVQWKMDSLSTALENFFQALDTFEQLNDHESQARILGDIGIVYKQLGDYERALEFYQRALALREELGLEDSVAIILGNLGNLYGSFGDDKAAEMYYQQALELRSKLGMRASQASVLSNLGNLARKQNQLEKARSFFEDSLLICRELGLKEIHIVALKGLAEVDVAAGRFDTALEHSHDALQKAIELERLSLIAECHYSIAAICANPNYERYSPSLAEANFLSALHVVQATGRKPDIADVFQSLSTVYESQAKWELAFKSLKSFIELEQEMKKTETARLGQQFDAERKTADREKRLAIAEKEQSILNNILPKEITQRLIRGENPIADSFDSVSILFMDIVDFTTLSTKISAQQLVHLLNAIFTSADAVMREFGLEKIKTIGDAYMAVAGAPIIQEDHAQRAAQAAHKLLDVMKNLRVNFPSELGENAWIESIPEIQVRIGVHCGPVAAGVVGENKFLYDLWGDAVNTASRMESHGEAGKIHISEEFVHQLTMGNEELAILRTEEPISLTIANCPLTIIPRGEIDIKGKGKMRTFFLERI